MTPQSTTDWLEALREAGPALRQRKWSFRQYKTQVTIRNEVDQCILCCLAEIHAASAAGYHEAWSMALGKAYGPTAMLSQARPIALASDHMSKNGALQQAIRQILGVPPQ